MAPRKPAAAAPEAPQAMPAPQPDPVFQAQGLAGNSEPMAQPPPNIPRTAVPTIPGRVVGLSSTGQPVQRSSAGSGVDHFKLPPGLPPPNRSWEWKRESCLGQTDAQYLASLVNDGWEPVMYERHPGVFAPEYDPFTGQEMKGAVRRQGLMLMDRDIRLTAEAKGEELRRARDRTSTAKRQYTQLDTKGAPTAEAAAQLGSVKQYIETVAVPGNPQSVD